MRLQLSDFYDFDCETRLSQSIHGQVRIQIGDVKRALRFVKGDDGWVEEYAQGRLKHLENGRGRFRR